MSESQAPTAGGAVWHRQVDSTAMSALQHLALPNVDGRDLPSATIQVREGARLR